MTVERARTADRAAPAGGWRASFGGFDLDTTSFELRRAGRPVHLEPQAFDVLAHLVRHRDRVVSKEELLDAVWGDRFVSESALTSRVKHVRAALGDDGRGQRYVRTVHGRGYRFAPVEGVAVIEADPSDADGTDGRFEPPTERTPLLGRRAAIADVSAAVRDDRLVTLLGIGGVGKSRLAAAVAHRCRDGFGDGVRFVRLDPCRSVRAVEDAVHAAAGVIRAGGDAQPARELRSRSVLFVLDDAEHIRDELATTLDHLLDHTVTPRFLVTSRVPLELPDERRVPVCPLPHGGPDTPAEQLLADAAGRYGRRPGAADRPALQRICGLLDGLPLAIELAAAALRVLAPDDLAERLGRGRLDLLRAHRPGHTRHADLVTVLAASHGRLDPAEQALLTRLATLPGTFTVADAERLCDDLPPDAVAAVLGHLVDLSMVVPDGGRFRLLTVVRLLAGRPAGAASRPAGAPPGGHTAHARRFRPLPAGWTDAAG